MLLSAGDMLGSERSATVLVLLGLVSLGLVTVSDLLMLGSARPPSGLFVLVVVLGPVLPAVSVLAVLDGSLRSMLGSGRLAGVSRTFVVASLRLFVTSGFVVLATSGWPARP